MQYKVSFLIELTGQFLIALMDFSMIAVIFNRFPALAGWNLLEIAFLYGISAISFSLASLISRGFETFERYIQMGELDRVLVRPVSPFLQVMAIEFPLMRLGRLGQGLVILGLGLAGLTVQWNLAKLALLLMSILAGTLVFQALFVLGAVSTIWTVSTAEFTNIFTNGGTYLISFPMTIYQEWFRNFFTFIVPLSFLNFLPALVILDKPAMLGLPAWIGWLTLPAALAFFGLSLLIWGWGLKKYQSTGT